MKKRAVLLSALGLLLFLCACGKNGAQEGKDVSEIQGNRNSAHNAEQNQIKTLDNHLSLLYHLQEQHTPCATENGYYYMTEETDRLSDGQDARHLMYIDFATRQEIYLCSNPACSHTTADCTSVFPVSEFPRDVQLFLWNDCLYLLSKEMDQDGSAEIESFNSDYVAAAESLPTVLYQMQLDGTGREKRYTFDPDVTIEDFVVGDANGLYLIAKKVTAEKADNVTYKIASERRLIYLDMKKQEESVLFSMDFNDDIDWNVIGCTGRKLILFGIDFGRKVSAEEKHSDNNDLYDTSYDVFATLDVDSGEQNEIFRIYAPKTRSYACDLNRLYYSVPGGGTITAIDLQTAEQKTLCSLPQDCIWGIVGDRIYTRDGADNTFYFINTATGEVSHCGLVNQFLGWSLEIVAETNDQALVIYDYNAVSNGDGSYSINALKYALISKDDLFVGKDSFAPIKMTGSGM